MKGSGSLSGLVSVSVLVHEYVTGGGLAGRDLPTSWAAEGAAMRRAIAGDFAGVPGARVEATLDDRLGWEPPAGVGVRRMPDREGRTLGAIAARSDYTALIAPEAGGILEAATREVESAGGRSLGSSTGAVGLCGDKARMAAHLEARGIPTPPTRVVDPSAGLPVDRDGPVVLKPVDGAGALDTFVVADPRRPPPEVGSYRRMLMQPYLPGVPMSASLLVDADGRATLIAVGRQRVEVDARGRVGYRGGVVPGPGGFDLGPVERAVGSVDGLRGFVGVDFLAGPGGGVVVLEINPRPTTSYVGLARLLPTGTIAGAWLAAAARGLEGTDWPGRLRAARDAPAVAFGADGSIGDEGLLR